jgi:hypothetical protein
MTPRTVVDSIDLEHVRHAASCALTSLRKGLNNEADYELRFIVTQLAMFVMQNLVEEHQFREAAQVLMDTKDAIRYRPHKKRAPKRPLKREVATAVEAINKKAVAAAKPVA